MIINKLKLNMKRCGITPTVDAAQGDIDSRGLELFLYDGEDPYLLPENLAVLIQYKKGDGKGGEYDTLPDGRPAWSARRNKLTILLANQMFTFPGSVSMTISLISDGKQISTFPIQLNVLPEAKAISENSEDYFNIAGFLVAPGNAEPGQFLKITSVNTEGRVTQVESGFPAHADWNAADGEAGHILNRPFYESSTEIKKIDKKFLPEDVGGVNVSGAAPGQMILVKSVDGNGKPTAWEAADPVTGADWDARKGENGHILNRPFYSTFEQTQILPACQPVFIEDEQTFMLPDSISIPAGTACTVNWNGTDYVTTAQDVSDYTGLSTVALGSLDLMWPDGGFTGNGEPFVIIAFDPSVSALVGAGALILPVDGATELTVSISGNVETITPIPKKYLEHMRCQKKYVINLDSGAPLSKELWELDPAELQASMVVIHEGVEKTAVITQRTIEYEDGTDSYRMYLSVPLQMGGSCIYLCTNHSIPYLVKEAWIPKALPDGISGTFIMAKGTGDLEPTWKRINEIALPGVLLISTTSGSNKTFWVTVDDSGNLTATQKTV